MVKKRADCVASTHKELGSGPRRRQHAPLLNGKNSGWKDSNLLPRAMLVPRSAAELHPHSLNELRTAMVSESNRCEAGTNPLFRLERCLPGVPRIKSNGRVWTTRCHAQHRESASSASRKYHHRCPVNYLPIYSSIGKQFSGQRNPVFNDT